MEESHEESHVPLSAPASPSESKSGDISSHVELSSHESKSSHKYSRNSSTSINLADETEVKEEVIDAKELRRTSSASRMVNPDGLFKVKVRDPNHSVYITAQDRKDHFALFPHQFHPKELHFQGVRANNNNNKEDSKEFETPSCYFPRRFIMITLMVLAATINYIMRTVMSVAVLPIAEEQGWSSSTKGLVLAAFYWGYVLTQIPGGLLTAKFGAKTVIMGSLILSGIMTVIFPFTVTSVPGAIISRILFGIFQAPCHPSFTQTISFWYPHKEKNIIAALIAAAYTLGQVIAMGATGPIHDLVGWRVSFYLYGALVVPWAIFWIFFFVNKPHEAGVCLRIDAHELSKIIKFRANKHKSSHSDSDSNKSHEDGDEKMEDDIMDVSKSKREQQEKVPWLAILRYPSYISLVIAYFSYNWNNYVFVSWLPTYLKQVYAFNLSSSGVFSLLPTLIKGIVAVSAGLLAQKLVSKIDNLTMLRKVFQSISLFVPMICFVILSFVNVGSAGAVVLFCIATGVSSCQVVGVEALGYDMSSKYAGVMMAITNTIGTIPGVVGVYLTGYMLEATSNLWLSVFLLAAALSAVGGTVFAIWASSEPVDFDKSKDSKDK